MSGQPDSATPVRGGVTFRLTGKRGASAFYSAIPKDELVLVNQKLADASAYRNERPHAKQQHSHIDYDATASVANKTVTDPVCGMTVNPATTPHRHQHLDKTYYFCSAGCRTKFAADPARYLKGKFAPSEPVAVGAIYTCPMHPEFWQAGPGSCPICGMALEPAMASAEAEPNAELVDMTRRFTEG